MSGRCLNNQRKENQEDLVQQAKRMKNSSKRAYRQQN